MSRKRPAPEDFSSSQLTQLVRLQRERESHLARAEEIRLQMREMFQRGESPPPHPGGSGRRGPRGALKGAVLRGLRAAGAGGASLKELAQTIQIPRQEIDRWIYSRSGKETKGLVKVARGVWAYTPPDVSAPADAPAVEMGAAAEVLEVGNSGQL